jgi:hypothetical protein
MKSFFVSNLDLLDDKTFKKDFEYLLSFPSDQFQILIDAAVSVKRSVYEDKDEQIYLSLSKKLTKSVTEIKSVIRILIWSLSKLTEKEYEKDEAEDIANDFAELENFITYGHYNEILSLFRLLKERAISEKEINKIRTYENGASPNLKGIGGTVEIRAVLERDTLPRDSKAYNTKIIGVVPVATIFLRFTEGIASSVTFQVGEERLSELIEELKCLQKDLEASKKSLGLKIDQISR